MKGRCSCATLAVGAMLLLSGGCASKRADPAPAPSPRTGDRGDATSTFCGDASPLFFIDGHRLDCGAVETLDPGEIDSIEVLKGAAAADRYGSAGANGVILITTKAAARRQ